jgi:LmbE family N-acetylglucosaminyl deacetylase
MIDNKTVLALVTHPDDAEFGCAGTLALLKEKGWHIEMATMTAGDLGSMEYSRQQISEIRKKEAAAAARLLDADYHCLELDDIFVLYDRPSLLKTIALIRKTRPKIVLTMSPSCYMIDHEITSQLVQTGCFSAGIVNLEIDNAPAYDYIPYLYYMDAMEGKDKFGTEIKPTTIVNISSTMAIKEKMLMCHESQRNWLLAHHGMDQYIITMKEFSGNRGKDIEVDYAEGFRQHLGHAYPQDNILKEVLGDLVVLK